MTPETLPTKSAYLSEATAVLASFDVTKTGLSPAQVTDAQQRFGPNRLQAVNRESTLLKFLRQFKDLMIILLLASAAISIYLGDQRTALILCIIVLLNASIGFFQEHKAERIMESLERLVVPKATVIRNGELTEVNSAELVPGDIIRIEEGNSIPADARLLEEFELSSNDFALTGESNPSRKFTHAIKSEVELPLRHNLVFMGTTVATGNGLAVVIGTGMQTELGRIASLSQETKADISPLQREMNHLARRITQGTIVLGTLLTIIALKADLSLKEAFIFAIGIAAAMIPQGLPAEVNVSLAQAAGKLARDRALVKKLSAVETLGATSIICTDKTGTLTTNEMTVQQLLVGDEVFWVTGNGYEAKGQILNAKHQQLHEADLEKLKLFFVTGAFASNATVHAPDAEHATWYCLGDPTEGALITLAHKAGLDVTALSEHHAEKREFTFDSARKRMSSVRQYNNQLHVFAKGAPESMLAICTHIWDKGKVRLLTKKDRDFISQRNEVLANGAMRNLAFAYKTLPANTNLEKLTMESAEASLTFLGLASMIDPPREEIPEAMAAAKLANIPVSIITGDNALTAKAIALKAGLGAKEADLTLISGHDLQSLGDADIVRLITKGGVIFSRVAPEDKLRIVELAKHIGKVVAVTGDGINDAPALKRADIGVAMGKTGTDVAKQSAEIVLLDDSFHTLVGAIQQGRVIFQNIRKTILSCITSNFGELTVILISLALTKLLNIPLAITAVEILAIDLVGEIMPLAALGWDPPEGDLMREKPRELSHHIMNNRAIVDVILSGLLMGGLGYLNFIFFINRHGYSPQNLAKTTAIYAAATTMTYVTILLCQFANILSRRTKHRIVSRYLFSNKHLLLAFGCSSLCILAIVYLPVLNSYLGTGRLGLADWLWGLGTGIYYLAMRQAFRSVWPRRTVT